jgi:hypothetical protein
MGLSGLDINGDDDRYMACKDVEGLVFDSMMPGQLRGVKEILEGNRGGGKK